MATTATKTRVLDFRNLKIGHILKGEFSKDAIYMSKKGQNYTMAVFLASDGNEYMIFPNKIKFSDGKIYDTEQLKGLFELNYDGSFLMAKAI